MSRAAKPVCGFNDSNFPASFGGQRFQLHALLREELRNLRCSENSRRPCRSLEETDRERRWREFRECLPEVIPAVRELWKKSDSRARHSDLPGLATGERIGELEIALRILICRPQTPQSLCALQPHES